MGKRILTVLLALALLAIPARGAGETVRPLTKEGPVWLAVRERGSTAELVCSADRGISGARLPPTPSSSF